MGKTHETYSPIILISEIEMCISFRFLSNLTISSRSSQIRAIQKSWNFILFFVLHHLQIILPFVSIHRTAWARILRQHSTLPKKKNIFDPIRMIAHIVRQRMYLPIVVTSERLYLSWFGNLKLIFRRNTG